MDKKANAPKVADAPKAVDPLTLPSGKAYKILCVLTPSPMANKEVSRKAGIGSELTSVIGAFNATGEHGRDQYRGTTGPTSYYGLACGGIQGVDCSMVGLGWIKLTKATHAGGRRKIIHLAITPLGESIRDTEKARLAKVAADNAS